MRNSAIVMCVLAVSLPSFARCEANENAATMPATATTGQALPEPFAIFQKVNPFSTKTRTNVATTGGPEAGTVLTGTAQADAGWTAFMQDVETKNVTMLSIGDPVARGRLTAIDLDSVQYESGGTITHVQVGQNLNGQVVAPTPAASQPAAPAGQPDQPPGPKSHAGKHSPPQPQIQPADQGE